MVVVAVVLCCFWNSLCVAADVVLPRLCMQRQLLTGVATVLVVGVVVCAADVVVVSFVVFFFSSPPTHLTKQNNNTKWQSLRETGVCYVWKVCGLGMGFWIVVGIGFGVRRWRFLSSFKKPLKTVQKPSKNL